MSMTSPHGSPFIVFGMMMASGLTALVVLMLKGAYVCFLNDQAGFGLLAVFSAAYTGFWALLLTMTCIRGLK